ncbi:hypothetical protein VNO80_18068 [Phaseolus coccineus]|uniref:Uncharacterized protein n=1 Tax=Phaseolus coccineus TaxID=3886 RepID=A0AAN9MGY7_PHACN
MELIPTREMNSDKRATICRSSHNTHMLEKHHMERIVLGDGNGFHSESNSSTIITIYIQSHLNEVQNPTFKN